MIILRIDGQLAVIDWSELEAMADYRPELVIPQDEFDCALGKYDTHPMRQCGLDGCHHWHNKGWIVRNTSGLMTKVGHDCADARFELKFKESMREFDREFTRKMRSDAVRKFQESIDSQQAKLEPVRALPYDAQWAFLQIHRLVGETLPRAVSHMLREMVRSGDHRISVVRKATQEEMDRAEAQGGKKLKRPLTIKSYVGFIHGVAALQPANDLRDLVSYDLKNGLERVRSINVETAKDIDLRRAAKWIGEFDGKVAQAIRVHLEARKLLNKPNLSQFERADLSTNEVDELRRAIAHLPDDDGHTPMRQAA